MKNNNKKGFTLIELLVVVLIIGILAAIALPQYFKAVEKARGAEALSLLGAIAGAQQRYYLTHDSYAKHLSGLDLDFTHANGTVASTTTIDTKNFHITLNGETAATSGIIAERTGGRYTYTLTKNYNTGVVDCFGGTGGTQICPSLGNFGTTSTNVVAD